MRNVFRYMKRRREGATICCAVVTWLFWNCLYTSCIYFMLLIWCLSNSFSLHLKAKQLKKKHYLKFIEIQSAVNNLIAQQHSFTHLNVSAMYKGIYPVAPSLPILHRICSGQQHYTVHKIWEIYHCPFRVMWHNSVIMSLNITAKPSFHPKISSPKKNEYVMMRLINWLSGKQLRYKFV